MLKKKILATAAAATLALVIPVLSFPSSAANGDLITVGDKTVKLVTDYNHFDNDMRIGQNGDTVFVAGDNTDDKSVNCHIADGAGVDGSKGLVFGVLPDMSTSGDFFGESYHPNKDTNGVLDAEGATDFVFWVDCTKEAREEASMMIVIGEWDYDANGNQVMVTDPNTDQQIPQITWRNLPDSADNKYYTLEADGSWKENVGTQGSWLRLPTTFKGYVRIPLSNFGLCWSSKDADNKFDLKHFVSFDFYTGLYPIHEAAGQSITVDNLGFAGSFVAPTTTTVATTTTTEAPATTTTAATDTTAAPATTATSAITTASSSSSTTAAPATTVTTKSSQTTTTTTQKSENPKTGEMPITAAVVTAVAFAGILVVAKKRNK